MTGKDEKEKRGRPRMPWVKIHCDGILHGSINFQMTLAEQMVWVKLFVYSAVSGGSPGFISDNDNRPLPHWYIANELHAPVEVLESTLTKCIDEGRIKENSHGIEIVNWKIYQSEYYRQLPYRQAKKAKEPTWKSDIKSATTAADVKRIKEQGEKERSRGKNLT